MLKLSQDEDTRRPMHRGLTLLEATVALIVVVVIVVLAIPILTRFRERSRRLGCEANLMHLGQAIEQYRTNTPGNAYPHGATYDHAAGAPGTSWWLEIMPFVDKASPAAAWQTGPSSGDFRSGTNPNFATVDGYRLTVFQCPSSPLPPANRPSRDISEDNRKSLSGRSVQGIATPTYAAVAGSAPDALDCDVENMLSKPHGRNTKDGKYGILSASGVMPINLQIADALIRDPKDKTILLAEQSDYARNNALDPPDLYDVRSSWPAGAFMGSTGDYGDIKPTASGVSGSGEARCWNVTTLRYGVNTRDVLNKPGFVVEPAPPRPPKEGEPAPPPPPYPPEGYGPGHNHGVIAAHPGGAHVLMCDGSVKFLNEAIDRALLIRLGTRDDGVTPSDF